MPQMAPISWLILFIVFSLAFLSFNMLNYYCYNNNSNKKLSNNNDHKSLLNNSNKNMNWKW